MKALVAAGIAGFFTIVGVVVSQVIEFCRHHYARQEKISAFRQAINTELKTLLEHYILTAGTALEQLPNGNPFLSLYLVTENYFTVYETNAEFVGELCEDERTLTVQTYIRVKSLLDTYRVNNRLIDELSPLTPGTPQHQSQLNRLTQYCAELKKIHFIFTGSATKLMAKLQE